MRSGQMLEPDAPRKDAGARLAASKSSVPLGPHSTAFPALPKCSGSLASACIEDLLGDCIARRVTR